MHTSEVQNVDYLYSDFEKEQSEVAYKLWKLDKWRHIIDWYGLVWNSFGDFDDKWQINRHWLL